jgi:hypothetical protein
MRTNVATLSGRAREGVGLCNSLTQLLVKPWPSLNLPISPLNKTLDVQRFHQLATNVSKSGIQVIVRFIG